MTTRDLVLDAARGIWLYRVRSTLTAASFAAGTAALVSLFAITDGAREEILRRIRALGVDVVNIRPVGEPTAGVPPGLTLADAEALSRGLPFVIDAAPVRFSEASVLLPEQRVSVRVVGTTPRYFELLHLPFRRGRAFSPNDDGNVCVLGAGAAKALFPGQDPYGALVKVGENWYRVIGVLAEDARVEGGSAGGVEGAGREVYLPITDTLRESRADLQALRELWVRIERTTAPELAAPVLERALRRRHDGRDDFEVGTPERLLRQSRATRGLLDALLGFVAAAGFALGGVGMMAVNWQAVAERKREIAIRRAVGARRPEILAQFLAEGMLLALAGAAAGILIGTAVSAIAAPIAGWPWRLSLVRVTLAGGAALIVGALSTLAPAWRAAALDPVAALRFER